MANGGALHYDTMTAYDNLVEAFEDASARSNCGHVEWTKPLSARFRVVEEDNKVAAFEAYFHLADWKAGKDTLSILIRAREWIQRSSKSLLKSTIHVSYFQIDQKIAKHLQSIHYDYDGNKDNHPIFHAQLCADYVDLSPDNVQNLSFNCQPTSTVTCFKDGRIPTSDMTFVSVLVCLAADHMPKQFFMGFLESVRGQEGHMPLPSFDKTRTSIVSQQNLRSYHWFAHME